MNQHIMYVVKNEAGEYLTEFSDRNIGDWAQSSTLAKMFRTFSAAISYAEYHGGQVYQVQLIISDTPVAVS